MNINIQNYEEFLLLYIDKELDEQGMADVERFLLEHPEYRKELDVLMETVSETPELPNNLALSLLKLPSGISAEEALVLELDNEISPAHLEELNQLGVDFPALLKERELMRATKLDKDELIPFRGKAELYRHESRVISLRIWKSAVAAAIIGIGLFFGLNETYRVDETELVGLQENGTPVITDSPAETMHAEVEDRKAPTLPAESPSIVGLPRDHSESTPANNSSIAPVSKAHKMERYPVLTADNTTRKHVESSLPVLENINKDGSNYNAYTHVTPERKIEMNMTPPDEVQEDVQRLTASRPLDANMAVQRNEFAGEVSANQEDDASIGHVLIVDEEKVNHSKFGGFVKKMRRTIEKKTNIKMPNQLRVAGFEIAIK